MSDSKKENLFAKLAMQNAKAAPEEPAALEAEAKPEPSNPSPAPPLAARPKTAPAKKPEPLQGKKSNPDYCQANAYVPKKLRRAVERALLDVEELDFSTLVEDLLRKWVKSRGVSE